MTISLLRDTQGNPLPVDRQGEVLVSSQDAKKVIDVAIDYAMEGLQSNSKEEALAFICKEYYFSILASNSLPDESTWSDLLLDLKHSDNINWLAQVSGKFDEEFYRCISVEGGGVFERVHPYV